MKKGISALGLLTAFVCSAGVAFGQAGAPTQRVHIPGIPDGTSIYKSDVGKQDYTAVGCVTKSDDGQITISDWRGAALQGPAGAPPFAATPPLVFRLDGDKDMLNFQVGHEVQITGPVVEVANGSTPAKMKVDSLLYLSRTCWARGAGEPAAGSGKK
jgi:hypothetical protein